MLPQAVIFDMDGLLIDTEKVSAATFQHTCHAHKAGQVANQYGQLIGRNQQEQRAIFADLLPDHVDLLRFDKDWRDLFLDQLRHVVPLKPYAWSLCQWLDAAGVTSADAETWTGGAVKAESWAHIHHHFVQVQDRTSRLEEQLRKTETQAAELEKERARLATLLQAHEEKTTCTKECST